MRLLVMHIDWKFICQVAVNVGLVQDYNHFPVYFPTDVCFDSGLTIYEAGGGGPLPKNGEEWHSIRKGMLKELQHYSQDLNQLIKVRYMKAIRQEALHYDFFSLGVSFWSKNS
jgi:hypothetical protein